MALKKSYTDSSQTTHTDAYWRLVKVYPMFHVEKFRIVLFIYHDADARWNDEQPVGYFETWVEENDELPSFETVVANMDGTSEGLREYLYTILKGTTELTGAEDVMDNSSSSSSSS